MGSQLSQLHGTNNKKRVMKKTRDKNELLRRNGIVMKSMESVLRPDESPCWQRCVKEVDFEPGVKE